MCVRLYDSKYSQSTAQRSFCMDHSYMFRLSQRSHLQAEQNHKRIIHDSAKGYDVVYVVYCLTVSNGQLSDERLRRQPIGRRSFLLPPRSLSHNVCVRKFLEETFPELICASPVRLQT
jgi:hypothetical protein